ncbi:LapA family protein [Ancylobacter sp. IITR112]|uniref:LapA family protein n=1 Tax=Ancylobacter sp. IITR112 TaxID=3138073 RepID=UPI00352BC653
MLRRLLLILIVLPVSVGLVMLAVANRHPVSLVVDPLTGAGGWSVEVPLFLVVFTAMIIGVVLGGVAAWLSQGRYRKAARRSAREARSAHAEVEELRAAQRDSAARPMLAHRRDAA